MYVSGPGRTTNVKTGGANRRRGTSASGFEPIAPQGPGNAAAASGAQAIQGVEAILALQSVEDPTAERRRAVQHGNEMLDALEEMKVALLAGSASPQQLDRLAALVASRTETDDPELNAALADIDLRVRVELAKRQRYPVEK